MVESGGILLHLIDVGLLVSAEKLDNDVIELN